MNNSEISLYFHIPFCTKKCDYCHFYVLPDKDIYKGQLLQGFEHELEMWSAQLVGKQIISIYFGGGTPALLGPPLLQKILKKIDSIQPFNYQLAEITLEANPDTITTQLVDEYARVGVNRLSIGIQTLDNFLLKKLGRTHDSDTALRAVTIAVDAGINNISVDLMYDIPGQTIFSWEKTLMQIKELPITHLSLYNLTIEPHTVFFKYQDSLKKELPDPICSTQMYLTAIDQLEMCGLIQYEISAFARKGKQSRHNTGYWTGRPFLGFGPSAFSYWEGRRFRNVANLNRYTKALEKGFSPMDFEETLEPVRMKRELLAIGLRLIDGVNIVAFENQFGALDPQTWEALDIMKKEGFLLESPHCISLSKRGLLFYDTVASTII